MLRNVLIFLVLALAGAGVSWASSDATQLNQVKFRVPLSSLAAEVTRDGKKKLVLSNTLLNGLAKGKEMFDILEVSYPGVLYSPIIILSPVDKAAAKITTPINAAQADFSAWKAEDDERIIAGFVPDEQAYIKERLADPRMRESSTKMFRIMEVRKISGEIHYKGLTILFVKDYPGPAGSEKYGPLPMAFAETPAGWKRTNALARDEIYEVIFPVLHNPRGVVLEVKP